MPFSDILGQPHALERVRNFLAVRRMSHGTAIVGPRGTGKKLLALSLAKAHYCLNEKDDFCDQCVNCLRIAHGNHPDVYLLELASNEPRYKIERLRSEFLEHIYISSVEGGPKFFIVDEANKLLAIGQNAILKTLEEPPEATHILLLAEELSSLLPTVRSRVQVIHMRPLPQRDLETIAKSENPDADPEAVALATRFARGSAERVREILSDDNYLEAKRMVVDALAKINPKKILGSAEILIKAVGSVAFASDIGQRHQRRAKAAAVLDIIVIALRDAAMRDAGADETRIMNIDQLDAVDALASRLGLENILKMSRFIQDARQKMIINVNIDMMLKQMVLELAASQKQAVLQG